MLNRLWTKAKLIWSSNWPVMSKSKNNNWCRGKIYSINWGKTYLDMKRRLLKVISFAMPSGDFGPPTTNDISIQKWRTNWLFSRRKSSKDLKIATSPRPSPCPELAHNSIKSFTRSTMVTSMTLLKSIGRKTIPRSASSNLKNPIQFHFLKDKLPKKWEIRANQSLWIKRFKATNLVKPMDSSPRNRQFTKKCRAKQAKAMRISLIYLIMWTKQANIPHKERTAHHQYSSIRISRNKIIIIILTFQTCLLMYKN